MKDAALGSNSFLDTDNKLHISVVILFQELKVELISKFTLEDDSDLSKSLFYKVLILTIVLHFSCDELQNFTLESLIFFVANIEGNLISIEILVSIGGLNQFFEKRSSSLWDVKVVLALSNFIVVKVSLIISVLVDDHEKAHNLSSEVLTFDDVLGDTESVAKVIFDGITRFLHGLLHFVKSPRL